MSGDRWALLGLAHPRASWFSSVARWATSASLPIDFVKCVSAAEARARLAGGRTFSALVVGGDSLGLDRDLVDTALAAGTVTVVVEPPVGSRWSELGAVAHLPADFEHTDLLAVLEQHATPIACLAAGVDDPSVDSGAQWRGRLVAVTGPGGTGASVTAMALAQTLSADSGNRGLVLLADLALHADQGMLHDAPAVVPAVQELVEAHRVGRPPITEVRGLTFEVAGRGYHLLLGLRRHRDWTALRARAFAAALDGLLRSYRLVIADLDPEVEGQDETGSIDIEDRNLMARTTTKQADVVIVVGRADTTGLHSLTRSIRSLVALGVDPSRITPTLGSAPRRRWRRAEMSAALASLLPGDEMARLGNPVFVPHHADLDDAIRDSARLPSGVGRPLAAEIERRLAERDPVSGAPTGIEPVPVVPGTLGTWAEETG